MEKIDRVELENIVGAEHTAALLERHPELVEDDPADGALPASLGDLLYFAGLAAGTVAVCWGYIAWVS